MKRRFLIITLFALLFLWLGNITLGQSNPTCTCTKDIDWNILDTQCLSWRSKSASPCTCKNWNEYLTCTDITASSNAASTDVIDDLKVACPTATITTQNFGSVNYIESEGICCEENWDGSTWLPVCTQTQLDSFVPCNPNKANAHVNTFGICVCNDGYKNIDKVCKPCSDPGVCCWISLNTSIPFIGKCIEDNKTNQWSDETNVTWETAFPVLMWSLVKILVTVILILSFVLIIIGGIMIATGDAPWGKKMIIKVVIGIALLGASGVILRLINPNFFG